MDSQAWLNLLSVVESGLHTEADPISTASPTVEKRDPGPHDGPLAKEAERAQCPELPVLEGSTPKDTNQVASIPRLFLGPASLNHEFPCRIPPSALEASKADDKESVPTSSSSESATSRTCPQKWYLHRAPTGKLTTIPPSPLCQDVTKTLLEEAETSLRNGLLYTGYRIFNEDPRKTLGLDSLPEVEEGSSSEERKAEESPGCGVVYAGSRIFNEDRRNHLEPLCDPDMNDSSSEKDEADTSNVIGSLLDDPTSFPFTSDDETGHSSESTTGTLTIRQNLPSASKRFSPSVVRQDPTTIEGDVQWLSNDPSLEAAKQTRSQNMSISILDETEQLFNPPLKQEVDFAEAADRPISSDAYDIQFRNRRGPLWNLASKDLKKLFLHAAILKESEFMELVCCGKDEVQTWLDENKGPIMRRSMEQWFKAHDALKNAGIQPRELNENVLDVFEWMTKQEQADFIKAYQRLYAMVKASQEGLHLTRWEFDHFSRLSLADKFYFIQEYKDRREEREMIVRRDTASFTKSLRRLQRDQDELPFADCSDLHFLQSRTGLTPKSKKVSDKTIPRTADNFHVKFLQFGMGQEKCGDASLVPTCVRGSRPTSQVKPSSDSKAESTLEQHTRRRSTTFTGDGRAGYRRLGAVKATHEVEQTERIFEKTKNSTTQPDSSPGYKSSFINLCELLPSDSEQKIEVVKGTAQIKSYAEAAQLGVKTDDVEDKMLDNCLQDCGRLATSLFSEIRKIENNNKTQKPVDGEDKATIETLSTMSMLERAPRKEWHGEHPGVKIPDPTPPPTIRSAEGVIPPHSSPLSPVAVDEAFKNLCIKDTEMGADETPILPVTKSEPCTPYRTTSPSCRGTFNQLLHSSSSSLSNSSRIAIHICLGRRVVREEPWKD